MIDRFDRTNCSHCEKNHIRLDKINEFHGGNIRGITKRLDYIKNLGVDYIWLTPFLKNPKYVKNFQGKKQGSPYHGYHPIDFLKVDPRFGNLADLKKLMREAHQRKLKVIFDIQINHTANILTPKGCSFCPYRENGYLYMASEDELKLKNPKWMNQKKYYHQDGIWGDGTRTPKADITRVELMGLDDLKTELPFVQNELIKIYQYWIQELKPDGLRIDVAFMVQKEFLLHFISEIKKTYSKFKVDPYIISEFGPTKSAKFLKGHSKVLNLDGHKAFKNYFQKKISIKELAKTLTLYLEMNGKDNLVNYISTHDFGRVLDQEYCKDLQQCKSRLFAYYALLMVLGQDFVILYGGEQGVLSEGIFDSARQSMFANPTTPYLTLSVNGIKAKENKFNEKSETYLFLKKLFAQKKKFAALGTVKKITDKDDCLKIELSLSQVAVFNFSEKERSCFNRNLSPFRYEIFKL